MTKELTKEEQSKDRYFATIAQLAEEMMDEHGKDFAMGAFVMAAQWIAEGKLGRQGAETAH